MYIPSIGDVLKLEKDIEVVDNYKETKLTFLKNQKIKINNIVARKGSDPYVSLTVIDTASSHSLSFSEFNKIEAHSVQTSKNDTPIETVIPYMSSLKRHITNLYVNFTLQGTVHYEPGTKRNTANVVIVFKDGTTYKKGGITSRDSIRQFITTSVNKHIPPVKVSLSRVEEELGL